VADYLFTGLIGALWLAWWLLLSRRDDIRRAPARETARSVDFRDRRLWGFLASYSMGAVPLGFVLYYVSLYLSARFGLSQADIGKLVWIPPLGWEAGYFFWGWLCDKLGPRSVRRLMLIAMFFSLPLALAPKIESVPLLMLELFVAMFMTSGFIIPSINYATWTFSLRNASLLAGLGAGSFSAMTALLSPLFGRLFDQKNYDVAFAIAALVPAAGFFLWSVATKAERTAAAGTSTTLAM